MYDDLAEKSLLGSILISPQETLPIARGIIHADDILDTRIRASYIAACELADAGEVIDPVSIKSSAEKRVKSVDSQLYVDCMQDALTAANIRVYAQAVHDAAIKAEIQAVGLSLADDNGQSSQELLRSGIARLQELQKGSNARPEEPTETAMQFFNYLSDAAAGKVKPFLSTGFKRLDALLGGGLVNSGLITLAARPGVGKSVVGLNIADNVAEAGHSVLFVSLEMSKYQLMCRRVGRYARLSYNQLQRGDIAADDKNIWGRITDALSVLGQRPLYISDKPSSISDVELKARAIPELALVVLDHMGLLRPDNPRANLYQQTTEASHMEKALALSLGVPVLSLCQLNREIEGRPDHRPCLADLRNSGAIEEDSDAVIFLHRPEMYLKEQDRPKPWDKQTLELSVAKNRHGATGMNSFEFFGMSSAIHE